MVLLCEWLYSGGGNCFVTMLLRKEQKQKLMRVVPYVIGIVCILLGFIILRMGNQGPVGHLFQQIESAWSLCQMTVISCVAGGKPVAIASVQEGGISFETIVFLIVCVGCSVYISWQWSALWIFISGCIGILFGAVLDFYMAKRFGVDISFMISIGCAMLASTICIFLRWQQDQVLQIHTQAERDRLDRVFEKMLSPEVAQEVLKRVKTGELEMEGQRSEVTILFADIRGFTELTTDEENRAYSYIRKHHLSAKEAEEHLDKSGAQLLRTVNVYLSAIAEVVMKHGGTLDKYIGDCVMAFWNEPTPDPHHAQHGVEAAIAIQEKIFTLNRERQMENQRIGAANAEAVGQGKPQQDFLPLLPVGVGVNTGQVIVGFMGSKQTLAYTVLGAQVNLASRLERMAGMGKIMIGESTHKYLQQEVPALAEKCTALAPCSVKGFPEMVQVWEVSWKTREMAIEEWAWNW